MRHSSHQTHSSKLDRIWQGFVIILLAIALPLFFSFVNDSQIEQALINVAPVAQNSQLLQGNHVAGSKAASDGVANPQ